MLEQNKEEEEQLREKKEIAVPGPSKKDDYRGVWAFAECFEGSAQHTIGIREANLVVAINIDLDAPIFESADYGIVGDYRQIVPAIIGEIKRASKGERMSSSAEA